MADQRDLVIKVKYGESLKRFTATITQNSLSQTISTLRSKIVLAFNFPPNADFILTYTDMDGDTVLLSDDDDLDDAALKQQLNPLRISVQLKSNPNPSVGSEPRSQTPNPNPLVSSLEEALKSLPAPLNNTVSKLAEDIVSKATSGPVLNELLNVFSKLAVPESQTQTPHPANNSNSTEPKVSSDASKETKKGGPTSDKPESSNTTRGPYFHPHRGGYVPTSPFCGLPLSTFVPPQIPPICRTGRNMMNRPMENNNNETTLPYPARFFPPGGHPYRKPDERFTLPVHNGIQCDGCDVTPIIGTRFKSNVKEDYDLCSTCFAHMGTEAEYTRIERPDPHRAFRDLCQQRFNYHKNNNNDNNNGGPSIFPMRGQRRSNKLESRFIQDVTVLDGTLMAPFTPFTKIWRMRNNGSTVWPYGTQLVWVGGDQFSRQTSAQLEVPVTGFPVDQEIDVAVDFCAPARAGRYISYWRLASPSGQKFGQRVWVLVQVEQPNGIDNNVKSEINLNLPPESSMTEMMDINVEPTVETETATKPVNPTNITYPVVEGPFSQPEPVATQPDPIVIQPVPAVIQPVVPVVNQPKPNLAKPVPITVTQPEPVMVHHAPTPLNSYPLIDLSSSSSSSAPPLVEKSQAEEEETLMKELEQMGFKQVDLNKEVLRLNKYDLEQCVEDLCGFSEWDPLLEELKEMGFNDKEANKKLLVKNGGSIKRVVMDLIAGEKDEAE